MGVSVVKGGVGGIYYYTYQSKLAATSAMVVTAAGSACLYNKVQEMKKENPTLQKVDN